MTDVFKKGNLLIIDDEVLLLNSTQILLEEYCDNIYTAPRGALGIEIFKKEKIHCVICDINMPEMNGLEVLKAIRLLAPEVPFIFYTGHGSRELMKEVIQYGIFDFINKPHIENLEEIVQRGLRLGLKGTINETEKSQDDKESSSDYLSEYHKLVQQLNSKS